MTFPHDQAHQLKLTEPSYQEFVNNFFTQELKNDGEDLTSKLLFGSRHLVAKATIIAKEGGVLAGEQEVSWFIDNLRLTLAKETNKTALTQDWFAIDGDQLKKGAKIVEFTGNLQLILKLERVILNFLSRLSGIATITSELVSKVKNFKIAPTRKVLWGLLDKKAVSVGGGLTHRLNLADAVLIKENHLHFLKMGIKEAVFELDQADPLAVGAFWDIEVETLEELLLLADNLPQKRPGVIMLDNFTPQQISEALARLNLPQGVYLEISGGINEGNITKYDLPGVDVAAIGSITKNSHSLDLSLRVSEA
jgi:nicotinate-nucleotide pyrophosphorylase (carboxylating)